MLKFSPNVDYPKGCHCKNCTKIYASLLLLHFDLQCRRKARHLY